MYLTPPAEVIRGKLEDGSLGALITPQSHRPALFRMEEMDYWAADNGCFTQGESFDLEAYLDWLKSFSLEARKRCLFATAPDVVGDWSATLERSLPVLQRIRAAGFPAAIVIQDGATLETIPWDAIDAIFVGGSTEWKLGPDAEAICLEADRRNQTGEHQVWIHMGRVNSQKRMRRAAEMGCYSADGTLLLFGPEANAPRLERIVEDVCELFGAVEVDEDWNRYADAPERLRARRMDVPDLQTYDVILVNSSAGKDSQAMLDYIVELAAAANVLERVVVVHSDLGRVEWQGTRELAEQQADHYGLRFEVVQRPQGDLLEHVRERGMWPDPARRYCTSDHKRGQISKVMTKLASEHAARSSAPCRILNCMGMRAQESPARAKLTRFARDKRNSNGRRHVDTWLPIHGWTVEQVWDRIKASGVPHHPAYDLGMPRLSCVFCIFAPTAALKLAGRHNPELLETYVQVEREIGHTFKKDLSLADLQQQLAAEPGAAEEVIRDWTM